MPRTGERSGYVRGRTQMWQGVAQDVRGVITPGVEYEIDIWVRLENATSSFTKFTLRQIDAAGTVWHTVDTATATNSEWTRLHGFFTLTVTGRLTDLTLYVEGPPSGVNFYVDDASLVATGDWRLEADERTDRIRKRSGRVVVVDSFGRPQPNATIEVRQTRRRFGFGSTITHSALQFRQYTNFFRTHFEWAVPEYEAKWPQTEPERGALNYERVDRIVSFCQANNITLRGHAIFWAVDRFVPSWATALPDAQLQSAMQSRIESVVDRYRDAFLHWDVNNEMLHGDFFQRRLGPAIRPWMFRQANLVDPDCRLFVNDYNVVSGGETEEYKAQIAQLLDAGAPIHGIGVQCHFSSPSAVNPRAILTRLDTLAELGLPIWCTEYDVVTPDENLRADSLETFYRVAFSHPAVEGILMWGFWAERHWRGADAALVDSDWTVNAAGRRYAALLDEWRTTTTGRTDDAGRFPFRGFHGEYELGVETAAGAGASAHVTLEPGEGAQEFRLVIQGNSPDFDGDGDVDLADAIRFEACLGSSGEPHTPGCALADLDGDGDVDLADHVSFQSWFTGSQ